MKNDCSNQNSIMQKPPFAYYGGKQLLAKRIINLIPEHTTYVEPFCGEIEQRTPMSSKNKRKIEVLTANYFIE